ncbi:metalloprotease ATP23 [Neoconidiobolus thromboides FSU 785]|nr:metalloprotease ATP23 [Neoconidiobolus thromboides FSU 785]
MSNTKEVGKEEKEVYSKWSQYFNYKLGLLSKKEQEAYDIEKSKVNYRKDYIRCEKWKEQIMTNSPIVVFLLKELRKQGCTFNQAHLVCAPCDTSRSSAFNPEAELGKGPILLCQNRFSSKTHLETTMAHELIHAYDHCRYNVQWDNLYHYACSSIRANSLSGDCKFGNEIKRGKFGISKQHQKCVRRRAILSVKAHPLCPDEDTAKVAVNAVFDSCFADTAPFDEIY